MFYYTSFNTKLCTLLYFTLSILLLDNFICQVENAAYQTVFWCKNIDNLHYRLIFDLLKKLNYWKEPFKSSKISKFG